MLDFNRLTEVSYLYTYLKEEGCFLRKKFGQNFLTCEHTIDYIVEKLKLSESDAVIEIGPGLGVITKGILALTGRLVCVEIDKKLVKLLQQNFSEYKHLEIIKADAMKVDFKVLVDGLMKLDGIKKVKIFSNLPYNIATPLIIELLKNDLPVDEMLFCVQSELKG